MFIKMAIMFSGLLLLAYGLASIFISSLPLRILRFPFIGIGAIAFVFSLGIYYIPTQNSGHVTLTIGDPLVDGQLIARNGQRGQQAELLPPGLEYDWRYPLFMSIDIVPDLIVPSRQFVILKAKDGQINPKIVAPKWSDNIDTQKMIQDVNYFLENKGTRGIQQYKVTTGNYRINTFQWQVEFHNMTPVNSTEVMVIESRFGESPPFTKTNDDEILSVPLVDSNDYRGIVNQAFASGVYAVHPYTEKAHNVPIILQTFMYGGGYTSKSLDLSIDAENDKLITIPSEDLRDADQHGKAFPAKTKDNHTVYIDVRVLGQIEPIQAPRFIGTIKDVALLDDKIIEPYTRNIITNMVLAYNAIELKNKKEELGEKLSTKLRERTTNTGFRTKTVEIMNIDIPPIVLISEKISSASDALKGALTKKEDSVKQAIKVRNLQDQADNQSELALATVANEAATENAKKIKTLAGAEYFRATKQADAERYSIEQEALAQAYRMKQQALAIQEISNVIGKDNAANILLQEKINEAADKFNVPEVLVMSGGESSGGTDIVGAHLLSKSIKANMATKETTSK